MTDLNEGIRCEACDTEKCENTAPLIDTVPCDTCEICDKDNELCTKDSVPALECEHVFKSYVRGKFVLHDFNLTVPKGKVVGLLGPNGCGKSTLLKLIVGLLSSDGGTIKIAGVERSEKTCELVSYLPERTYFNSRMRVNELIDFFEDFYSDFDAALAKKLLLDLNVPTDEKLKTLSKGMKEKVQLVMVMSRKTRLYLLDEPIGGVDPALRDYILNTILANYNPDASVIITTHLIHDIEPALDEFVFMGFGGAVIMSGDANEVREKTGKTLDELFREEFRYAGQIS